MSGKSVSGVSAGAILSALLTLGCCLPLPFIGALGAAGASVFLAAARPWLLVLSIALLGAGAFQVVRGVKCRVHQKTAPLVLLGIAVVVVIVTAFFPQLLAGWLADLSGGGGR